MTRPNRAILFPRVSVTLISAIAAGVIAFAPVHAFAEPDQAPTLQSADPVARAAADDDKTIDTTAKDAKVAPEDITAEPAPALAATSSVADAEPAPSVETPLHHLYCVEYARVRSGFQIFGDAKNWWQKAKNFYSEITAPATDTVMVFAGSHRIRKGHVAVVTKLVGPREIRVDQANWENHGEIDHNTPVLDVSKNNDWSQVRVWDMRSGQFGAHIYAIKGFIARTLGANENAADDSEDN